MSENGEGNLISIPSHLQLLALVGAEQVVRQVYLKLEVSELLSACYFAN